MIIAYNHFRLIKISVAINHACTESRRSFAAWMSSSSTCMVNWPFSHSAFTCNQIFVYCFFSDEINMSRLFFIYFFFFTANFLQYLFKTTHYGLEFFVWEKIGWTYCFCICYTTLRIIYTTFKNIDNKCATCVVLCLIELSEIVFK